MAAHGEVFWSNANAERTVKACVFTGLCSLEELFSPCFTHYRSTSLTRCSKAAGVSFLWLIFIAIVVVFAVVGSFGSNSVAFIIKLSLGMY